MHWYLSASPPSFVWNYSKTNGFRCPERACHKPHKTYRSHSSSHRRYTDAYVNHFWDHSRQGRCTLMTRQNRFNPTLSPLSITALPRQTVQAIPVSPVKSLQSPMPTTDPWVPVPSYWSGCLNKSPQWNKAISWGPNAIDLWDRFCCRRWLKLFQQSGLLISISRLLIWLLINGFARITTCDLLKNYLILVAPGVIVSGIFA